MKQATTMGLREWASRLLRRKPHVVICSPHPEDEAKEVPQLLRWWLIPRNRFFNIYLHKTLGDDQGGVLHDHPWDSLSLLLKGRLGEEQFTLKARTMALKQKRRDDAKLEARTAEDVFLDYKPLQQDLENAIGNTEQLVHERWKLRWRPAGYAHRLFLPEGTTHTWTLFLTFRKKRKWGFWCPKSGWRRWEDVLETYGSHVADGCGER